MTVSANKILVKKGNFLSCLISLLYLVAFIADLFSYVHCLSRYDYSGYGQSSGKVGCLVSQFFVLYRDVEIYAYCSRLKIFMWPFQYPSLPAYWDIVLQNSDISVKKLSWWVQKLSAFDKLLFTSG